MPEEVWEALEGEGSEPDEFQFFVKIRKTENFIKLLEKLNLKKSYTIQKGEELNLFLLDIREREDFSTLATFLNSIQRDFLR